MKSKRSLCLCLALVLALLCNIAAASETSLDHGAIKSPSTKTEQELVEDTETEFEDYHSLLRRQRKMQAANESTRVNIFQKLKESIGMTIIGCILICFMPLLIWKNEGRHVRELARIDFCKNKAVVIDCTTPTEETVGRLVHFVGEVTVGEASLEFNAGGLNVTKPVTNAVLLKRTCYIYQKFEDAENKTDRDRMGGGETRTTTYTLRDDWTPAGPRPDCTNLNETNSPGVWDKLVSISGVNNANQGTSDFSKLPPEFAEKLGMHDPDQAPHGQHVSPAAKVGEFALSSNIVLENAAAFLTELIPVPVEYLPDDMPGCEGLMKGGDNVLRTFVEGATPRNGDCKVVYEYIMDGFECSFVVAQTNKTDPEAGVKFGVDRCDVLDEHCFGKCNNDLGDIWMVRKGRHELQDMIDMAKEDEKKILMTIRVVAWVLLCVGWVMLFSPFLTALQVLPILANLGYFAVVLVALIVSCLCCFTVTTVAYIRYRPLMATGMLLLAGGIWGLVAWRLNIAAEEGGEEEETTRF